MASSNHEREHSIQIIPMANPWSIQSTTWMVVVACWLLSPIISWLLRKLFAYLIFDASTELPELQLDTIPALKVMLRELEEQRMVRAATARESEGSGSDLERLDKMEMRLKSAMCQAEDILDLVDYHRIEKEVTVWYGTTSVRRFLHAVGGSIIAVCRGSWVWVLQPLLHAAGACLACWMGMFLDRGTRRRLRHKLRRQWRSLGEDACGWCSQLVANITNWCTDWIADARYYRDWSYEQVGFKINEQKDINVPIIEGIRLRKQIKGIEDILTYSKRSNLLNHAKNDDKESSSNCSAKECSSKQNKIDELSRVIGRSVFGRDQEREKISRMLREGPDTSDTYYAASSSTSYANSVIVLHGITGSGKSTLTQYVYDYEKGAGLFDPIMFIHVGKTFSVGRIFRDMLEQITKSRPSKHKGINDLLKQALKDKRFLLVLDDLWVNEKNIEEQGVLLKALCAGRSGSKILVTAERKDAAAALGAHEQLRILDLDEDSYLSIFRHHAQQGVAVDGTAKYEQIGRRIARKLFRSHIASVTVARRLQTNNSISFWEATASNDMLNSTMGALWWSYMQLDAVVRRCFVYLGTFPQGYVFKREVVVDLWIAQGFVEKSEETEDVEALGQSYFDTLLAFAFLRGDVYFGPSRCTMHDLLHELAVRIAGTDSFRIPVNGCLPEKTPPQVQHLFIEAYNIADITMENILRLGNLRTLIILEKTNKKMKANNEAAADLVLAELFASLFMKLRKLRVLIIKRKWHSGLVRLTVPATISKMKHLRYLVLRHIYPSFPRTLIRLHHLQILDVPRADLLFSAEDMANLFQLRLLREFTRFPNIGRLTSLREIPGHQFDAYCRDEGYELKQLKHLNNLQGALQINIVGDPGSEDDALEAHLASKKRLTKLSLFFHDHSSDQQVLEGLCPPEGLEWLTIRGYSGSTYPSWMLNRHHADTPKHHGLEFQECTAELESIPEDSNFLTHVRLLRLCNCDWEQLPDNMNNLVSLVELDIRECDYIKLLPTLPKSLLEISIIDCSVLSTTCQHKGHINWRRIQHIRRKKIIADPEVHLNQCCTSPCMEIQGPEVIKSHELVDQLGGLEALGHILNNTSEGPIELSYALLQNITNDFSEVIGSGGFGVVYMGVLQDKKIAIKKLFQNNSSDKQFEDELKCLKRVKHKNIVRFLGYCSDTEQKVVKYNGKLITAEERQRFLCFEYVPNKSLHEFLEDGSRGHEWDIRYQLIDGICQGLCYLHNKERITHLDLKPENILLDVDMVPKIADFGISRLFGVETSRIITEKICGTWLYMSPEYRSKGEITFKSDIYSFGLILKKLLLGNNDLWNLENGQQSPDVDDLQFRRYIEVAQICMDDDPSKRPTIDCIINTLSEKKKLR